MTSGRLIRLLFFLMTAFICLQPAAAKDRFGNVTIEKGALVIVRNGLNLAVKPEEPAEIKKNDMLQAGSESLVNWQVDQSAVLQIGSNAVLMLRPWKRAGSSGYITLTYGITKVKLEYGEGSRDPLVLKTPAAIIRLAGSAWIQVTLSGNTLVKAVSGETIISTLQGKNRTLATNQLGLVVDGGLIVPDGELAVKMQQLVNSEILDMPDLSNQQASFFINEADIAASGAVTDNALRQSRRVEVSVDETFDEPTDESGNRENKQTVPYPVSDDLNADLDEQNNMATIDVDSETDELGVIQVMTRKPENVFGAFDKPKIPGNYFDLEDKTSWSLESGLIAVTFEK